MRGPSLPGRSRSMRALRAAPEPLTVLPRDPLARLCRALLLFVSEHGAPNTVTCGELRTYYGGPLSWDAGSLGLSRLASINEALRAAKVHATYTPRRGGRPYQPGRFALEPAT